MSYLENILKANVYEVAEVTPCDYAKRLSARLNNQIYLKREDLQSVFSFKLRGAYNKISKLTSEQRQAGIVAASAGNHAQGVALAAKRYGCRSVIVMPETTPSIKVEAVKDLGGEVVLHGDSYQDAEAYAIELATEGLSFVHPFDDPDVIAGQGTVAMEFLRQVPRPPDVVFVCVGGGGLISGIAAYTKALYPDVKIIGVEHDEAPSMYSALEAGEPITLNHVGVFADGAAVKRVGKNTFELCKEFVDEIILVDTDAICAAIKDVFEDTRTILEPAGALAVAGMKSYVAREKSADLLLVATTSGANINFTRLRHVAERADLGEEREAVFSVTIPEKPGSFRNFCRVIGGKNITEFNYRYSDDKDAQIFVGFGISSTADRKAMIEQLNKADLPNVDLTNNEVAKVHIRHMVGGRNAMVTDERIFSFQFPERPGALLRFLDALKPEWNISLFHYRNHGADIARVLVGLQVPGEDEERLQQFLSSLSYQYWQETDNPACKMFL